MNNVVFYYSNTSECKRIAAYVAEKSGFELKKLSETKASYNTAVLVFPVYCQAVPDEVKLFLNRLKTENLAVIAAYGKMSHGNVLFEIQRKYKFNIIAAAYVPTKHTYLCDERFKDFEKLNAFIDKLSNTSAVVIPRSKKNVFAGFFPKQRTKRGVKISKIAPLCDNCRLCEILCPQQAINNGKIGRNCIRCTRCVDVCPNGALFFETSPAMAKYLSKKKVDDFVLYL